MVSTGDIKRFSLENKLKSRLVQNLEYQFGVAGRLLSRKTNS